VSPPAAPPAGEPVVLTWEGPLEISPRDDDAEPLAMGDDVALRFEEEEEPVRFADSADGATGRAKSALYFAGRERIELLGPGGAVELESPKAGAIRDTSKLAIELGTGYVLVPASGVLTGRPDGDGPGPDGTQRIAWDGAAEFRFAVEDGRMTDRLELAAFDGGGDGLVEGTNRDAELTGSRLEALFDSEPGGDARLVQLNVADARAEDGRGGRISGDGLEVHFARGRTGEDLDPTRAIIRGNALAQREGRETIRADLIDASLARAEPEQAGGSGDIIVTVAEAEGSVEFDDGAGVAGRGETLWADALEEKAVIGGEGARVRRDGTEITGPRIDLDSKARRVAVEGEGTFTHDGGGGDARSITASWTERMTFDDLAGSVECVGGVNAETVGPDRTRDRAEAARLVVDLDPFDEDAEETGDAGQRVRRAVVFGTPTSARSSNPAGSPRTARRTRRASTSCSGSRAKRSASRPATTGSRCQRPGACSCSTVARPRATARPAPRRTGERMRSRPRAGGAARRCSPGMVRWSLTERSGGRPSSGTSARRTSRWTGRR
jgi:lipopolysaccharide export system protein LptA